MSLVPDTRFGEALVAASADRRRGSGLAGRVQLALGSSSAVVVEIADGRVIAVSRDEPEVRIPFTQAQFQAWLDGDLHLSRAYMRGDIKPEGSSGALLAALEVLDDPAVVAELG